jgi:CHAT domain-containing protein
VYELQKEAAENLQLKAEIFGQLGDHARALELLNRANDIATALSQRNKMADIARFKSHQYLELGDGLRAERLAIDALRLHGFAGAQLDAVSDMMLLAELALRSGRSAHAQSWVHTANAVARQLDLAVARGEVALTEARIASHLGNSARVLSVLEKNQLDIAALGAATRWEAHALRARAFAGMDQLEAAEREGRLAVATIEKTRQLITSGPLQTSYTVSRVSAYADLVTTLLRMQRLAEALEVADAARGRALLEQLSARSTQVPGEAAQQIVESERLLQRIDWLVRQLQVTNEVPKRDRARRSSPAVSIQRELADAQRRYELLLRGATRVGSSDATMLASPIGVLRANAVQKSLDRTEALLEYFVADAAVVGFVVTADTIVSFTVGVSATELADRVHLAGKLLRDASTRAIDQKLVLRRLHQLLLEPAIASGMLRTMETLIVVPHGALVHLPFVALVDSRNRYVGEQFDVITSPSASIFAVVRGRSRSAGPGPHAVFAPLPDQLPGTREEATAVAARLRSANTFVGGRATETEMRKQLAAGGHVHIATHGTLASASPMFSHIETAADSTKGSRSDGRLEVHEVLGMSVRSELVFLSGCETGAALAFANAFRRGEDYATLSQAFLFAGAGNVIATLWRIDDAGAAAFASTFYDALQSSGPSAALATAQRAMMRHPRWSSPRYWAGYTLSGTGRAVSFAKSPGASVTSMNAGSPTPQRQLQ